LPKAISEMVGGALLGAAANRQVCPTISEMTFGNHSRRRPLEKVHGAVVGIRPTRQAETELAVLSAVL